MPLKLKNKTLYLTGIKGIKADNGKNSKKGVTNGYDSGN